MYPDSFDGTPGRPDCAATGLAPSGAGNPPGHRNREVKPCRSRHFKICHSPIGIASGTAPPPRSGSAKWADAEDEPDAKYRDAHVWYDNDNKDNFGAYKLLIADIVNGKLTAVPRGVMAAGAVMQGSRGGVDLPEGRHRPGEEPPGEVLHEDGRNRPWDRD